MAEELGLRGNDIVQDLTQGHMLRLLWRDGTTDEVASVTPAHLMTVPFVPLRERAALTRLGLIAARMALTGTYRAPEYAAELDDISATDWFRLHAPVMYEKFFEPTSAMFCGYGDHEVSLAWMMWANGIPSLSTQPIKFWTVAGGVGHLATTRADELRASGATIKLGTEVRSLTCEPNGVRVMTGEDELTSDAAVVATTPRVLSSIVPELSQHRRDCFESITYSAHDLAYYLTDDLGDPPGGSLGQAGIGLLLPTAEGFDLASNTHWAPTRQGRSLVLIQSKRRHLGPLAHATDDAVLDALWAELATVTPAARHVTVHERLLARWDDAIPTRPVGSLRALRQFRALGPLPRVAFAGDYLRNSSVGAALITGQQAATELLSTVLTHDLGA
ncbi:FAD-dependent oxidoreductase [Nocardioides okcheonensis]|uniref:FAD-dependent oxidoreductase n=1 Tax=Nocardioides okcheonensis TaxID=2894081 RepID=UPI0038B24D26